MVMARQLWSVLVDMLRCPTLRCLMRQRQHHDATRQRNSMLCTYFNANKGVLKSLNKKSLSCGALKALSIKDIQGALPFFEYYFKYKK